MFAMCDIANPKLLQVATPELDINSEIKQGKVSDFVRYLQPMRIDHISWHLIGGF
jgi:hypothetical protein